MLPPVGIEPWPLITSDSKSIILSELVRHVLLRRSLNFCSCTTLDLDDLVRINRARLFQEPQVSVLQANAKLVQKGECWTRSQIVMRGQGSIPIGGNILSLDCFVCTQ